MNAAKPSQSSPLAPREESQTSQGADPTPPNRRAQLCWTLASRDSNEVKKSPHPTSPRKAGARSQTRNRVSGDLSREGAAQRRRHQRSGFTLVEMLLVLGVLIVFVGMTVPSVMQMFGQQKLTGSAERVRGAIASARFRAIETGIIYQFCCEANGSRYVVVPFEPDHAASKGGTTSGSTGLLGRASGQMATGIVFSSTIARTTGNVTSPVANTSTVQPAASHKLPAGALEGLPNASELASVSWSIPILFHPEGSANADTEITISDSKRQSVKLRVRAFTGAVSMERLVAGKR